MSINSVKNDTIGKDTFVTSQIPNPPTITGYSVNGLDDTALDPAGGQTVLINGANFQRGATVTFNGSSIAIVTWVSANQLSITSPANSAGTYQLYIINADGGTAIYLPGVVYSTFPTWTTAQGTLGSYYETQSISNSVVASGDAPITYSLFSGSLPTGATLNSNGTITGTSPVDSGSTTYSFTIKADDAQLQSSTRSFSLTINTDVVTWSSPADGASYTLAGNEAMNNVTLSATSAAGYSISYAANALPTGVTLSSNTISGTPTVEQTVSTLLTATAATTNRTATRTINWTVILGDTYWKYTTLLLNGNTPTTTFINDASLSNNQLTIQGDTRAQNYNPYQHGYYSNYFNGTSDYLTITNGIVFGTGAFTVEAWFNCNSFATTSSFLGAASTTARFSFRFTAATTIVVIGMTASITFTVPTMSTGVWYHVAIVRDSSNNVTLFLNGVRSSSGVTVDSINLTGATTTVGTHTTAYFPGYVSNLRIVLGSALYDPTQTTCVVPTSVLTPVSGTVLLTCKNNSFTDSSQLNQILTATGTPQVSSAHPFTQPTSVTVNTGTSVYFNGSTDYLTLPTSSSLTLAGNFTVEAWLYMTAYNSTTYQAVFALGSTGYLFYIGGATGHQGQPLLYNGSSDIVSGTAGDVPLNAWTHVAWVRNGTTVTIYVNGVSKATGSLAATLTTGSTNLIGYYTTGNFPGYISNLRVVNGVAVYTGNFTVPTGPLSSTQSAGTNISAITGTSTSLLTLQGSQIVDASSNLLAITPTGSPKVVTNNYPFTQTTQTVSNLTTLGSAYFDGTGDYLTLPAGSMDFLHTVAAPWTIQCWFYVSSVAVAKTLFSTAAGSNYIGATLFIGDTSSGDVGFTICKGTAGTFYKRTYTAGNVVAINTWNHIAVTHTTGGSLTIYVNGVSTPYTTVGSGTGASSSTATYAPAIGRYQDATPGGYLAGYINDLQVVNGTALYTGNFNPTYQPLTAVTNTQLLTCQYNGGANNNGFTDQSKFNNIITRSGNTNQGTFSPYSQTGWSNFFNGSADYLTVPATSTAFGTSAWTIECWIYLNSLSLACVVIDTRNSGAGNNGVQMSVLANGSLYWFEGSASTIFGLAAGTITTGRWYHIAFVRTNTSANGCTLYIDGVSKGNSTSNLSHAGYTTYIGRNAAGAQDYMNGYISNLRIVNGAAVYSGAFTPSTTPLAPIAKTSILTCQDNRFIDNSPYSYAVTIAGTPSARAVSPFSGVTSIPTSYSTYFDGTGDYLTIPASSAYALPADFTIELWFNVMGAGDNRYQHIFQSRDGTNNGFLIQYDRTNATIELTSDTGFTGAISANAAITDGVWYHFAAVRIGSSVKIYLNGTQVGTTVTSAQSLTATGTLFISRRWVTDGALHYFNGYISNLRLVKGIGVYTGNFTVPTSPLATSQSAGTNIVAVTSANTNLLTCQSSTLIDNSTNYAVITAFADAKPKSFNPFNNTTALNVPYTPAVIGGSMYFDGTGDLLSVTVASGAYSLGTGDYTVECWIYIPSYITVTYNTTIISSGTGGLSLAFNTTGKLLTSFYGTSVLATSTGTVPLNQWVHIASTRSGTAIKQFINGILDGTGTSSGSFIGASNPQLGIDPGQASNTFTGYIADFRVTKGVSLYNASFYPNATPLTPATTIGTTLYSSSLLMNGTSGGIIDYHSGNDLETVGNTQLASEDPYAGSYYSNYFTNSANITLTQPALGSIFTIEMWVYPTTAPSGKYYYVGGSTTGPLIGYNGTTFALAHQGGWSVTSSINPTVGQWNHIAVVREGTGSNQCKLYVNGVLGGTGTEPTTFGAAQSGGTIGQAGSAVQGYVSNLRITNNQALYTGTFTPATSPLTTTTVGTSGANVASSLTGTVLLLTCQTNKIIDNSASPLTLATTTATVKSMNPFQQNTGKSIYFDGTGDYLQFVKTPPFYFGANDFTIESWIYLPALPASNTNMAIVGQWNTSDLQYLVYVRNNAGTTQLVFGYSTDGVTGVSTKAYTATGITAGTWCYIAVTRSGSNFYMFVNGAIINPADTFTLTLFNAVGPLAVGRSGDNSNYLTGYIKDLRITRGIGRYTTAFTPPTAPLQIK